MNTASFFCWNIANPSIERAKKQLLWLIKRSEDFFILTEVKNSKGCLFIKEYFQRLGYNVIFPKIEGNEYGVMLISKHILDASPFSKYIDYLPFRAASAQTKLSQGTLDIIGLYVPSRDRSIKKTERKRKFLTNVLYALKNAPKSELRIFLGDLNILEPSHIPHYSFFEQWEYDFYDNLIDNGLKDAFRHTNPDSQEYSWVGRTGDGYRYDHCFVSDNLLSKIRECYYLHEPRDIKLSDHSAIITKINL